MGRMLLDLGEGQMMSPRPLVVVLSAIACLAWIACEDGDGNGTKDVSGMDAGADGSVDDPGGLPDTGPTSDWPAPAELDNWRIVFNYRGREGLPSEGLNELWLMDPLGHVKEKITDLAGLESLELSCEYGCFISEDLKWMAITTGPPDHDGFDFAIGQFTNADLNFKLIKDLVLTDKIDFKFAADRLYFSEKAACGGASCQYTLAFIDLSKNMRYDILLYPTADELEQSNYSGHFKAGPDGLKLALLNTTIRSVTVNMWKDQTGLAELDYICKLGTKENCVGTGSEYRDTDPVAISNDGTRAVFFTFSDRFQRARLYDLEQPGNVTLTELSAVPVGSYIEHVCDFDVQQTLPDWHWQRVIGDPVFVPDDSEVIFLVENACPAPNGTLPKKPQRNLMRVKTSTLEIGKVLEEQDVFNITKNPEGDIPANIFITGFRVTPDGATVVFTGTPIFDQSGDPIKESSSRHRNDREVFRIRIDGTNRQQLTNDLAFEAQSPRVVPPKQ